MDKLNSTRRTLSLTQASIDELATHCREEDSHTQPQEPILMSSCFELFRRAVVEGCEQALAAVYAQYRDRMVRRACQFGDSAGEAQDTADRAFDRFLNAMNPERFARFTGIGSVLSYLGRCVRSEQIDRLRKVEKEQQAWATFVGKRHSGEPGLEQSVLDDVLSRQFAADVYARLKDEQERLVVRLNIELGYKPSEIACLYPAIFPAAQVVNRVRERVIRRLAADPILQEKYKLGK